jgi:hypothetical protein
MGLFRAKDRMGYGLYLLGALNRESALKLFPRFASSAPVNLDFTDAPHINEHVQV